MSTNSSLAKGQRVFIAHLGGAFARIQEDVPPNCMKVYVIPKKAYYLVRKDQIIEDPNTSGIDNRKNSPSRDARLHVRDANRGKTKH